MKSGRLFASVICAVVTVALMTQMLGCGTIIYPERRGQKTGRVDVGIALLDALWLLVFIIPGVVAFAVDFTTGAIYLPGRRASTSGEKMVVIRVNPAGLNEQRIKEIVMRETRCSQLELSQARIYRLEKTENTEKDIAEIAKSEQLAD